MRTLIFILICLLPRTATAQGDYSFHIAGSYEFVRCNSVETVITAAGGSIIFSPLDYEGIGPIRAYADDSGYLILRTVGRENRPVAFERPIENQTWYFTIDRSTDIAEGPFSPEIFAADARFSSNLAWSSSRHPLGHVYLAIIAVIGLVGLALATAFVWFVFSRPWTYHAG